CARMSGSSYGGFAYW
nr:immunoglobulin heavy chain junction region [Mus musculus]